MTTNTERRTTADGLSLDVIYDLLADRRRRYVVYCLYLFADSLRLPRVTEQVIEWESGTSGGASQDECRRVSLTLQHSHIPKLADFDVVAYNPDDGRVELGRNAVQLRPYLEVSAEADLNGTDTEWL